MILKTLPARRSTEPGDGGITAPNQPASPGIGSVAPPMSGGGAVRPKFAGGPAFDGQRRRGLFPSSLRNGS